MDQVVQAKIEQFFTQHKNQTFKKGEIIIRADDNPSGVFFLKNGLVKEYAISKKGEELIINVFKPISFFPMSWALNGTKNAYFYEALTDLEIWRAPKDEVLNFIKANPDVLFNLICRVYRGVDGILTRMTYLMSGNAYARLITELIIYTKRFGVDKNNITLDITEKDLAAQSGLTRETVSREMKLLIDKGLVSHKKNKFVLRSLEHLETEHAEGF